MFFFLIRRDFASIFRFDVLNGIYLVLATLSFSWQTIHYICIYTQWYNRVDIQIKVFGSQISKYIHLEQISLKMKKKRIIQIMKHIWSLYKGVSVVPSANFLSTRHWTTIMTSVGCQNYPCTQTCFESTESPFHSELDDADW